MSQALWAISSHEPLKPTETGICWFAKAQARVVKFPLVVISSSLAYVFLSIATNWPWRCTFVLRILFLHGYWLVNTHCTGSHYALEALPWVVDRKTFLSVNEKCLQMWSPWTHSGSLLHSGTGLCLLLPRLFSSFSIYFLNTYSVLLNVRQNLMCKRLHLPTFILHFLYYLKRVVTDYRFVRQYTIYTKYYPSC